MSKNLELCNAFDNVIRGTRTTFERGGQNHVVRDDGPINTCVGSSANKGSKGVNTVHYALRDLVLCDQETLTKYFRGVEECFRKWVDSFIISQVNAALKQMNPPLFTTPNGSCTSIYNAFACGINVYLNPLLDKNFMFCAVSIHTRQEYHLMGDKILAYVVFPTIGIAVSLR